MSKIILITGATDGIGFAAAKLLAQQGHILLLHGRSKEKLQETHDRLLALYPDASMYLYLADLSEFNDVEKLAGQVKDNHPTLDILINNAGVLKTPNTRTNANLDIRFMVNSFAPYLLTKHLLPIIRASGRIINLSSAAQSSINIDALLGNKNDLRDMDVYAQSKLAITIWTHFLSKQYPNGPVFVAVNPGSLLASKMVKEGFGIEGSDINIGARILERAALSEEFASSSGRYFDNDTGVFADPHLDVFNDDLCRKIIQIHDDICSKYL